MWSDGTTMWVADARDRKVYAYALSGGARDTSKEWSFDSNNNIPHGHLVRRHDDVGGRPQRRQALAYDRATGERLESRDLALGERNADARGIWSDGETMWVLDERRDAVFAYDLESGALLAEYALDPANGSPTGIWSDGVTLWVSDPGSSPRRLFAYRLPTREEVEVAGDDASLERVRDEEFNNLSQASNNSPRGIWSDADFMYVADASDARVYTYNMPDAIDARLASLTLSGVDIGEFHPHQTHYEGVIGEGVTETVVVAEAMQPGTNIEIEPDDADGDDTNGHQVATDGLTEITIRVTSADGARTKAYRVTFEPAVTELVLSPTWKSFEWPGTDGVAIAEAGVPEEVVAVYTWDETAGRWLGHFPGLQDVPGLNTLTAFSPGVTYWVAATQTVSWTLGGTGADEE